MMSNQPWMGHHFSGRLAIQQRVLPSYRVNFFDMLAEACEGGLYIIAGSALPEESISMDEKPRYAHYTSARNIHMLNPGSQYYLLWQSGLINWLKKWDPDVLIIEANPRFLSTNLAIHWMHSRGRPVIGWGLGGVRYYGPVASVLNQLRKVFIDSLDGMIAYSHKGAEQYRLLGVPAQKVFTATNAVTTRPNQSPPERPADFEGTPKVVYVGRLQSRKGINRLLEACASLAKENQPSLWIIGDGPERGNLEALAEEIYPRAEFKGIVRAEGLSRLLNAADLFVLPGTGGLAVQEAMAHALPVIVGRGDGTQEDLVREMSDEGGKNGWIVPSDDVVALSEILAKALSDVKRLRRMGKESYRIVSDEINIENMVRVFIQAVNSFEG